MEAARGGRAGGLHTRTHLLQGVAVIATLLLLSNSSDSLVDFFHALHMVCYQLSIAKEPIWPVWIVLVSAWELHWWTRKLQVELSGVRPSWTSCLLASPCTMLCLSCAKRPVCRLGSQWPLERGLNSSVGVGEAHYEKVREGSFRPPPPQWAHQQPGSDAACVAMWERPSADDCMCCCVASEAGNRGLSPCSKCTCVGCPCPDCAADSQ